MAKIPLPLMGEGRSGGESISFPLTFTLLNKRDG